MKEINTKDVVKLGDFDNRIQNYKNILYLLGYLDNYSIHDTTGILDKQTFESIILFQRDNDILSYRFDQTTIDKLEATIQDYKNAKYNGQELLDIVSMNKANMHLFNDCIDLAVEEAGGFTFGYAIYSRAMEFYEDALKTKKLSNKDVADKYYDYNTKDKDTTEYDKVIDRICVLINIFDNTTVPIISKDGISDILIKEYKSLVDDIRNIIKPYNTRMIEIEKLMKQYEASKAKQAELQAKIDDLNAECSKLCIDNWALEDKINTLLNGEDIDD